VQDRQSEPATADATRVTAWDLIGYDGDASIRIVGGRALYETAIFYDGTRQQFVKLARLEARADGLAQVNRYVAPDTPVELVTTEGGSNDRQP
jgi:hypothetical protein